MLYLCRVADHHWEIPFWAYLRQKCVACEEVTDAAAVAAYRLHGENAALTLLGDPDGTKLCLIEVL